MSRKQRSKFKILLIGFVLTKLIVAALYLSGMFPFADLLFSRETAVAQEQVAQPKAVDVAGVPSEDEKVKQFAEIQAVMNQLEAKRMQLEEEESRIKNERDQLEQLKLDIDMKLEELTAVQVKIDKGLVQKAQLAAQEQQQQDVAETAKLKKLVKVYSSMSPKKAADIIGKLDMKVVYQVFSSMKGEAVGQILTYVDGQRAAEITERLAAKDDE